MRRSEVKRTKAGDQKTVRIYPVMCAWCEAFGREPVVIRMVDYPGSHGICRKCELELLAKEGINERVC